MRFDRYIRPRDESEQPSPRRIAAAKRAIQRQFDAVPLFPDMVKHHTPEARIKAIDAGARWHVEYMRGCCAANWREARLLLRTLPPMRQAGLRRYWQCARMPGHPAYLLTLIREASKKAGCFWKRLRELKQLTLVGQGRLPRHIVFKPVKRQPNPVKLPCSSSPTPKVSPSPLP